MQTHTARLSFAALLLALAVACLGTGCTPSGPKALLQGAELIRKGNYEAAITKLKIAKDLLPNDARAWNYLGLAYHGAGQYGEAIIAYQRAQELDKNLAEARYNLGELFLEQGNPVSAAEELTVFTALQPKSVEGWIRLGDAHFQNQRADRAQTSYYTALNLKRETPEAFNGLGLILLQRKNPRDAYRYFVEAIKYDPNYAPAILNMAVVAQTHLNSPPTALAKYREYLAKAPGAANTSEVQAAIRQLETALNPRPEPRTSQPEIATNPVVAQAGSNTTIATADQTTAVATKATNAAPVLKTNLTQLPAARTNASVAGVVVAARTNSVKEGDSHRPVAATNKPPAQTAAAEVPRPVVPAEKPPGPPADSKAAGSSTVAESTRAGSPLAKETGSQSVGNPEETPLEVVKLEETQIQAAGDISPAGEIQTAVKAPPASRDAGSTTLDEPLTKVDQEQAATSQKRGFFQRINPANLFRSEKQGSSPKRIADIVTPLPPDAAEPAPRAEALDPSPAPMAVASAGPSDVTQIPGAALAPRYQYGRIKKPVRGDRPAAERLFERGVVAQSRRDPSGAASFFGAAIEADATYFPAHYNLGLVGYSTGQWYNALSAFETALVLDPNSAETRYNFALTLQKARFPTDAARELERLLERKPDDTRAMLLLGNVYSQDLNDVNGARNMYQKLLAREPQHPQATAIRYWLAEHP